VTRVQELVTAARAGIENLSPAELADEVRRGDVLVVDVREPAEAARGTLPGALVVPRGLLEFLAEGHGRQVQPSFVPDRRVVLCSAVGARSALAAMTLQALGYGDVAHLAGGVRAWVEDGRPLHRDQGDDGHA
jgi:rhodanese-related sulfurtransferase